VTLLIAALAVALMAAAFVVYPILFRRWGLLGDAVSPDVLDREARKRVALAALKDVEYDRAAGKLDETDYGEIRGKLEQEALAALRAADAAGVAAATTPVTHGCGFVNPPGSRFCSGCGQRLA
jgi:hypothetical protein